MLFSEVRLSNPCSGFHFNDDHGGNQQQTQARKSYSATNNSFFLSEGVKPLMEHFNEKLEKTRNTALSSSLTLPFSSCRRAKWIGVTHRDSSELRILNSDRLKSHVDLRYLYLNQTKCPAPQRQLVINHNQLISNILKTNTSHSQQNAQSHPITDIRPRSPIRILEWCTIRRIWIRSSSSLGLRLCPSCLLCCNTRRHGRATRHTVAGCRGRRA
jgi:hypothetical protein